MEIEQPQRLQESEPTEHFESEPMEELMKIEEEEDIENQWADFAEMEAEIEEGEEDEQLYANWNSSNMDAELRDFERSEREKEEARREEEEAYLSSLVDPAQVYLEDRLVMGAAARADPDLLAYNPAVHETVTHRYPIRDIIAKSQHLLHRR